MKIEFSRHAAARLELREIPRRMVESVVRKFEDRYYDVETHNLIALASVRFKGRARLLCVAYQEIFGLTVVVTAHPIDKQQAQNRVLRGRWIKV